MRWQGTYEPFGRPIWLNSLPDQIVRGTNTGFVTHPARTLWAGAAVTADGTPQPLSRVAGAIAPRLEKAEIERTKLKPTDSLDAYDYYLRGMSALHQWTSDAITEA